jgi:hypothetical protein
VDVAPVVAQVLFEGKETLSLWFDSGEKLKTQKCQRKWRKSEGPRREGPQGGAKRKNQEPSGPKRSRDSPNWQKK